MYSRFSPQFIEASLNSRFTPGCRMPCPRCGSAEVSFHDPRRYLPVSVSFGRCRRRALRVRSDRSGHRRCIGGRA